MPGRVPPLGGFRYHPFMENPFSSASLSDPAVQRERFLAQEKRLLEAIQTLAKAVPQAYVVGGFVRDALRGVRAKDVDLEVYGVTPQKLEALLETMYPGQVVAAGRSFGILKIILEGGRELDVSIPRRESKNGSGHTGFLVESDPSMSPTEALRRRDFTINALAADPFTGEIQDPFGGLVDLEQGLLRVVDTQRFQDDPLRVYRGLQLTARLQLAVEPNTMTLMREMVSRGDMKELSKERITEEIKKLLLKAEKPSLGFELADRLGLIERDYPELHVLHATEQEKEWHPEGNVWIHTLMVIDQAAKIIRRTDQNYTEQEKLQIMLGALAHDLGKPATTEVLEGRIRSRGHEAAGEEPTKRLLAHWSFAQDIEYAAVMVAKEHLKPGMLAREVEKGTLDETSYPNAVRKLLKRIHPVSWRVLLASAEADWRGRALPNQDSETYPYGEFFTKAVLADGLDAAPHASLLQGRDLIELGLDPGPRLGEWINAIEEARDRGEIRTREEALAYVKEKLGLG